MKRNCDVCSKEYVADMRNIRRGWGLCCSKSCAAKKREQSKPGYNAETVALNNVRRTNWNSEGNRYRGRTSEGYKIYGSTAYDEFDEPVYDIDPADDTHPFDFG